MRIKRLTIFTEKLAAEIKFYTEILGFSLLHSERNRFTVKAGWSELTFEESPVDFVYHYCFLIPSNKLDEALQWMEKKTDIVKIEGDRKTQFFDSWNAESFYFFDASGNIAEFIVRHDLKNETSEPFSSDQILCVNEIGLPTADVAATNKTLEEKLGTEFYKGDQKRFGTNGDAEGIFLMPNYTIKKTWFPTEIELMPLPFTAEIENAGITYRVIHENEKLEIEKV